MIYSAAAINARLQAVITLIDAGPSFGQLVLLANSTVISTIPLRKPSGTVNGGVLTFTTPDQDPSAAGTGSVDNARIQASTGNVVVSGLTVGIPLSGAEILLVNGLNSTLVTIGQAVQILGAQITGS